ncbi:ribonuclease HIII [Thermaerobacillus caldiproteolyticus]|uniref:Ribonuclease HIII n=1 Tax=Thermaerobacillus caldiproteolyticus TaxID=247480 RepID=A0A7W0BX82_9BACL|nr:ribonuclease HIII [Anoxybacillus caldiproteolyticus]MBA2873743.1 ribonuclease HIII [Anoxybacillus caldiproteolyticus]QPA30306.1 ribonuclease HIII [Anoxybacillus caldiproteolyticus]
MANHVIKATKMMIDEMRQHYASYITDHLPTGALFVAKLAGCTITAYRSGKVLFQGKEAEREAARWTNESVKESVPVQQPHWTAVSAIGSDEVGTGDYFGPIVVVAAYVAKENIETIKNMGVKDSKLLTDEAIRRLAPSLMKAIPYCSVVLSNPTYNEWQASGMPQTKMKALLHNEAIRKLVQQLAPLEPEAILIDQFIERDLYFRYLEGEKEVICERVYCYPKAETIHVAVAAASMIARYVFLNEMEQLSKQVGMELPKGAGEQVDQVAAKLMETHGLSVLDTCAKLHFANTDKARRIAHI